MPISIAHNTRPSFNDIVFLNMVFQLCEFYCHTVNIITLRNICIKYTIYTDVIYLYSFVFNNRVRSMTKQTRSLALFFFLSICFFFQSIGITLCDELDPNARAISLYILLLLILHFRYHHLSFTFLCFSIATCVNFFLFGLSEYQLLC